MIRVFIFILLCASVSAQQPAFAKYYKSGDAGPPPGPIDSIPNNPSWRPDSIAELELWLTAYDIDADGTPNEENRQQNRRTEFQIISNE